MGDRPTATILSVGTELTEGIILNTHFRFLGAELRGLGFYTHKAVQIPDDSEIFRCELRRAVQTSSVVIITGGLGPTSDDLTREIVAEICDAPLSFQTSIWDDLVDRYAARGRTIAETNRKQALIPEGFQILPNEVGTAPGFCAEVGECLLMALPGPPAELEQMFLHAAMPLIQERFFGDPERAELVATALMIPESTLEQALQDATPVDSGLRWSTRVAPDRIVFTLRAAEAKKRQQVFSTLVERFSPLRLRMGDRQPSALLSELLKERGWRIALAESCSGGLIAKMLTDIPGSSGIFWGSVVSYSNEAKRSFLGVAEGLLETAGAASAEAAAAMSEGLLERTPVEVALAITGIAGPDGGSPDKPVGTVWISARTREGDHLCREFHFRGRREAVRRRSSVAAMLLAEAVILGVETDFPY
jgi:nicotinamide-nucleotide amidase